MNIEVLIIVAVAGLAISALRAVTKHAMGRTVADIDLEERVTDLGVGVRDGDALDVWVPPNARVPSKVVRLLRGRPEPGRGLRLSLYASKRGAPGTAGKRLVRTWLGPYPEGTEAAFVEVTLSVGRFGQLRVHAVDKSSGRKLTIRRDERNAAPSTAITTRQAGMGEDDPS